MLWLTSLSLFSERGTLPARLSPPLLTGVVILASFGLLAAVYYDVASIELPRYRQMPMWAWAFPPADRPWQIPYWLLEVHAGRMLAYPQGGEQFASTLTLLLVVVGSCVLWKGNPSRRRLVGLIGLVLGFGLVAAFLGLYPYGRSARTMLYAAPGVILLAGVGSWFLLRHFLARNAVKGAFVVGGVMIAFILAGVMRDLWRTSREPDDAAARAAVLALANARFPGEIWIMPHAVPVEGRFEEVCVRGSRSSAVTHYYALRHAGRHLLYRPRMAEFIAMTSTRPPPRIRVIINRSGEDDAASMGAAEPYVAALNALCGAASREVMLIGVQDELVVWTWSGEAAANVLRE